MSLKENIEALKEELNSEEKFFESAVRTERFVKRYQKPLIGSVVTLLLASGGAIAYSAYTNAKIESSNVAFNTLLSNPKDTVALKTLKNDNPELYDVWSLSQGIARNDVTLLDSLKNSKAFGVSDIASYESAAINEDKAGLESYTKTQGALYKDLALVELAVMAIHQGNISQAHEQIALIPEDSPMYQVGRSLSHYGVK
ncbi:hypothetical protein [Sulfuricurvum sp.]|uniref:hypothetical protein n=1 Tax=Sulfuricurvum sp. TaxID=2025608 RepID=UPI0035647B81